MNLKNTKTNYEISGKDLRDPALISLLRSDNAPEAYAQALYLINFKDTAEKPNLKDTAEKPSEHKSFMQKVKSFFSALVNKFNAVITSLVDSVKGFFGKATSCFSRNDTVAATPVDDKKEETAAAARVVADNMVSSAIETAKNNVLSKKTGNSL